MNLTSIRSLASRAAGVCANVLPGMYYAEELWRLGPRHPRGSPGVQVVDPSKQQVVYNQSICPMDTGPSSCSGEEVSLRLGSGRVSCLCLLWPLSACQCFLSARSLLMCPSCPLPPAQPQDSHPLRLPCCLESTELPVLGGIQIWIVPWQKGEGKTPVSDGMGRKAIPDKKTKTLPFFEDCLRIKKVLEGNSTLACSLEPSAACLQAKSSQLEFWSFALGLSHHSFHIGKAQICLFHSQVGPRRGGR